jgi:hypothetical protein
VENGDLDSFSLEDGTRIPVENGPPEGDHRPGIEIYFAFASPDPETALVRMHTHAPPLGEDAAIAMADRALLMFRRGESGWRIIQQLFCATPPIDPAEADVEPEPTDP